MNNQLLLQNAEQYVRQLFATRVNKVFTYHNISHTEGVVKAATAMATYYQLPDEERLPLLLAAWFHDTGYSKGKAEDHEKAGQEIAGSWLRSAHAPEELIEKVNGCIEATRMPQSPKNLTQQIICDADLHHLGTDAFKAESKLLRKELNELGDDTISKKNWRKSNIEFLQQHRYFTDYALTHFDSVKQSHLRTLIEKEEGKGVKEMPPADLPSEETARESVSAGRNKEEKIKKEKESRTDRGIGTMFRIMSENHVSLSQMADSKANIMISVNTIVLSIMVSVLFSKLQYYPQFIIPTIILCSVSLCAIIFAILATRPNVNKGTFNQEDIQEKKVNLLFFGNFFKMELPDYEWAMKEMMNDREYLYGSMIKDIYYLGKVLAKKYKFLRLSYNIFMFGLVIAMIAFIIAFVVSAD